MTFCCNQIAMNLFISINDANHYLLQSNGHKLIQFNECRLIIIHRNQIYMNLCGSINDANHYLLQSNGHEPIQFNECRSISIHRN